VSAGVEGETVYLAAREAAVVFAVDEFSGLGIRPMLRGAGPAGQRV